MRCLRATDPFSTLTMLFRLTAVFLLCAALSARAMPAELTAALDKFRADGPKGWAFTQTTRSDTRSMVERHDPLIRAPFSWTLIKQNDREPTEKELNDYRNRVAFRSNDGTASVKDQIIPESCELVAETDDTADYRFKLAPGSDEDRTAAFMTATFTLHRPSGTITRVDLGNHEPFSPMFAVKIAEARTIMDYSTPEGDRPSLLMKVHTRVRGRAFWFRSLDDDLHVTYSDHVNQAKPASKAR